MKSRSDKMIFRTTEEEPKKKKKLGEKVKANVVEKEKKPVKKPVAAKPKIERVEHIITYKEEDIKAKEEDKIILDDDKQKSPEIYIQPEQEEEVYEEKENEQQNYEPEVKEYEVQEQEEEEEEELEKKKTKQRPRISKKPYQDKVVLRYTNFKDEDFYNL